jgi:hypothetical protein
MGKAEVSGIGEDTRGDQEGIAGEKESDEEAGLNKNDCTYQSRAAPLDQALDVEQEMKDVS